MGGDGEMNEDLLANSSPYLLPSPYPPCFGFSFFAPLRS